VWDDDSITVDPTTLEPSVVDVWATIRALQSAEETSLHNRLLMQVRAVQVSDESSYIGEDIVRVPRNPFIDDAATECNAEDDERIAFGDDISDLMY
jgi:hypothetical protein